MDINYSTILFLLLLNMVNRLLFTILMDSSSGGHPPVAEHRGGAPQSTSFRVEVFQVLSRQPAVKTEPLRRPGMMLTMRKQSKCLVVMIVE